jgi:flagellar basal-body rod protein FlgB
MSSNLSLTKTNEKHMDDNNSGNTDYEIVRDDTTSMRQDGNNVDIDNEMTNLAANTIKYEALINEANSKITMRNFVINGGK